MGFFEKVKNMFTEEVEDDDVKVEQIKKEVTHVAIESPSAKEANDVQDKMIEEEYVNLSRENKPVFFDDNDFVDLKLTDDYNEPVKEKEPEKEIYGSRLHQEKPIEEKKIFKPTPIISPIYGVLDKNYRKEDIVSRTPNQQEKVVESPIDTIRNKAYGTLEDELENTLFGSNSILFKKDEEKVEEKPIEIEDSISEPVGREDKLEMHELDSDMLAGFTNDISKKLDEILVKKETYEDNKVEDDLLNFIDTTLYKDGDE